MTLLVGVVCEGGVIIGSDSAATMGSLGQPTVAQPVAKVAIVEGSALIAVSGPVGLGQRLTEELAGIIKEHRLPDNLGSAKTMQQLRQAFWPYIAGELEAARVAGAVIGQAAQASALSATLVALCRAGRPRLYQFDQQGAPEEATENLPFVCLGSGQANADPFMAFLRGIFWEPGQLPTIPEGMFAVVWTIEQCIAVSPAYLAGPVQVFVLTQEAKACVASQVRDEVLQEHRQAVTEARQALRNWRTVDTQVPKPPIP